MTNLTSNRELYLGIERLMTAHKTSERSLESYLLAVLGLSRPYASRPAISLDEFYELLSAAFTAEPLMFDDGWRAAYDAPASDVHNYAEWRRELLRQIVDLREMSECGSLSDKHRYFGIKSPRGAHWCNFEPVGYLECATAGSLGGWEPGDETGRTFVPGECAVVDADGQIGFVDPKEVVRSIVPLPTITWEQFQDFIYCGQIYE